MNTGTALKEPLVQTIYGSTYSYDGDPRRIELGAFEFGSSALECFFVVAKAYLAAEYGLVTRVRYGGGSGAVGRFLLENVSWDADTRRLSATHTWENMTANAKDEENATDISPPQTVWEFDVVFAMGLETTECAHITSHVCDGTSGDDAVDRSEQNTTHTSSSHTHTHRDTDRIHSSTTETDTNQVLPERAHTHTHTVVGGKGRCRGRCRGRARATALHLDHLYRLRDPPSTIWGCVYGQFDTIGMASYHFDHPGAEGSYISYEEAPAAWQLDDGSRPPHRKLFLDPVYDSDRKVFTATVEWDTGFNGDTKWEYTIAFADDFRTVVAGAVERYGLDGKLIGETLFNQQLYYRLCYDEM
ncbi:hypothetical protein SARC_10905 [Sphaeroforma arctica JP610]|uniref:Uncharacterized protein n=1 Tax=Sphaeroforma arctica JP610 TaxID=667725 RepID=A0A0L0FIK8_9EUKA|nr:hypothetical protein SARC_10905 [Sphaeroforma arctica JP610]KNC76604.1 hypothetical protein SARC_10905 [Sphaeroforma arctica JP610]|eukprot:XP_014150506.1 hypothetical protein SARC_10905 [Sphaeroforma arctica JP610]